MVHIETEGTSHSSKHSPNCCHHSERRALYRFGRESDTLLCVQCAIVYRPVLRRSLEISVIVGSLLTIINQGDVLMRGAITALVVLKICLTYMVPFCVATYSALAANHVQATV